MGMMNDEYSELGGYGTREIFMNIQQAAMFMDPAFRIGMVGAVRLVQFFARMVREKKLNKKDFENIQEFIKATGGKYDIMNLPTQDTEALKADLDTLGIHYMILPDLNLDDGMCQIALYSADKDKFASWYTRFLTSKMQGGSKELQDLRNLTTGRTSIISIPLEEDRDILKEDFDNLTINYTVLPDLNIGDGYIQLVVANSDLPKAEHWFKQYREHMLDQGKEIKDMSVMSFDQYQQTGQMQENGYIQTADAEIQAANEKYETNAPGEVEKEIAGAGSQIRGQDDAAFLEYQNNPDYIQVTIDRQTLVANSSVNLDQFSTRGHFASRIPGTWADKEKILVLPEEQVFVANDGRTYAAFLDRNSKALILSAATGKPVPVDQRPTGASLYQSSYSKPIHVRGQEQLSKTTEKAVEKTAEKAVEKTVAAAVPKFTL